MVKFLNREGIIEGLKRIFESAESEIIIVVPYVKLSVTSYSLLKNANDRGIEITIVYKEGTLNDVDRNKLKELNNLNLLTHPDIHSKCYCNEELMVIGSMNLYEYSERYNREMAILIDIGHVEEDIWQDNTDTEDAYSDAIDEIRTITTSSKFEKKSATTLKKGFNLKILKPDIEYVQLACNYLNKYLDNKKFIVNDDLEIICFNYVDQIDIVVDYYNIEDSGEFKINRILIRPKWDKIVLDKVHNAFKPFTKNNEAFKNFTVYWDYPKSSFTIYRNTKLQPKWNDLNYEQTVKKFRDGIEQVTDKVKGIERKLR